MSHAEVPRTAATLLLIRDLDDQLEVFMVERPGSGDFGGLHVFPGGKVDSADGTVEAHCVGIDDEEASRRLGVQSEGIAYWVAAIRESFEEAGAVLCYRDGVLLDTSDGEVGRRFAEYRDAIHSGALSMAALCELESLVLATDRVHYFSHWITPESAPRRFDTRFFLAEMPPGQEVVHRPGELEDGLWVRPRHALAHAEHGRWKMIYPTITTLESLAGHSSVASIIQAVENDQHLPEVTVERHRQGMQHARLAAC